MNYAVDNKTSQEYISPWGDLSWTEGAVKTVSQNAVYSDFRRGRSANIVASYEGGNLDDSLSFGTHSRLLVFQYPSSTENVCLPLEEIVYLPTALSTSSTTPETQFELLTWEFLQVFAEASEEVFEHGMESVFSLRLASFIEVYQELAISIVSGFLDSGSVDKEVAMETLHQLGQSEHEPTYDARLNLLVQNLESDLAMIRYGAMYGLSSMDEPKTIPEIERAYQQETYPDLLKFMRVVLDQLHETQIGV